MTNSPQQSKMASIRRSTWPAILLTGAAVGLGLFYFLSPTVQRTTGYVPVVGMSQIEQELHWVKRVQQLEDRNYWTSKNCPKLMALLIELCPCMAKIDPMRHPDDIEEQFVECMGDCISESNSSAVYELNEEDYKDDDGVDDDEGDERADGSKKEPKTAASDAKENERPGENQEKHEAKAKSDEANKPIGGKRRRR